MVRQDQAHAGNAALTLTSPADQCIQIIPVEPGAFYRYQFYARTSGEPQPVRLQVNWADAQMGLVMADIQSLSVGSSWTQLVVIHTAPFGAAYAILFAQSSAAGPTDWDDFSWQVVLSDP